MSSDDIRKAWHLFQVRRALLTSNFLRFSMHGVENTEIRLPEIKFATASILYVNAVGILDEATASQMPIEVFKKCDNLANRLGWLNKRAKLLDFDSLDKLRDRRNDVAHEQDKPATVDELNAACSLIEAQLVAWNLVQSGPKYELHLESGQMRGTKEPGFAFEHDRILRVLRGGNVVYEAKQTVRFA